MAGSLMFLKRKKTEVVKREKAVLLAHHVLLMNGSYDHTYVGIRQHFSGTTEIVQMLTFPRGIGPDTWWSRSRLYVRNQVGKTCVE